MNKIQTLDCILRDGGYCNNWNFGFENTKKILSGLVDSGIEIIECGFLTQKVIYDKEITRFTNLECLYELIPDDRNGKLFVAMINFGEYDIDSLPEYNDKSIDGIRVAFHKKDYFDAMEYCKKIKEKGYLVFVQPMVSLNYNDEEFLTLINIANKFNPYAFYIVDSFGMMKGKDLTRLFYLVEHNLNEQIKIGFHSHNNMQLAYSNAQILTTLNTSRDIIIDSSIYGMGRGAGNLNTELFIEYLNDNFFKNYDIKPLLSIIDDILDGFYKKNSWGYSLPNYISALHNSHPNYASYFSDKNTLTVEAMNELFEIMDDDKRISYDKFYAEKLYVKYMERGKTNEDNLENLKGYLSNKKVLIIAPGKSSLNEYEKISNFVNSDNVVTFSVNFDYNKINVDFIFFSNLRRFQELEKYKKNKCIVTSNIKDNDVYMKTSYSNLLSNIDVVRDNAGLMAIKFILDLGVNDIYLAGFDGYSTNECDNYIDNSMELFTKISILNAMNRAISEELSEISSYANIHFLTNTKLVNIN